LLHVLYAQELVTFKLKGIFNRWNKLCCLFNRRLQT